jgi:hypothetical protein
VLFLSAPLNVVFANRNSKIKSIFNVNSAFVKQSGLLFLLIILFSSSYGQRKYWQQEVSFTINVTLNDKDHTLDAFETIQYINNSPDTLQYIWFHLWPNAYKNDKTAFSEQRLQYDTKFYFSKPEDKGYINRLNFKVNNEAASVVSNPDTIDVIKLILPTPLPPGKKTTITTPFHVKLPYNFSRGGHVNNDYQISQWFPQPAVYDHKGWHPMSYIEQGEFYSEFGSYDVEITAPAQYVVAATGVLQDAETVNELKTTGKHTATTSAKTWHYKQANIHAFAWFASKEFTVAYDTVAIASKIVDVFSFYKKDQSDQWKNSVQFAKDGVKKYSAWIGDYPYSTVSVVQGNENENSGGMEYPTITLITTTATGQELDATIVHEVGHNWFYGALASNERKHPWMDEGMNTFYQKRYEREKYGTNMLTAEMPKSFRKKIPNDFEDLLLRTVEKAQKDQPIETPSEKFSRLNYGLMAYNKASKWMMELEKALGRSSFDKSMKRYYKSWKFKHPYPQDFKENMAGGGKVFVDTLFTKLNATGPLTPGLQHKPLKASFLFNLNNTDKCKYINIAPALGINYYDKLMLGALVHTYQLPLNNFNFIGGFLYGTGSARLNKFGRASYTVYRKSVHIEPAISLLNFTINDFEFNGAHVLPQVTRITPSLKVTAFPKDAISKRRFVAELKSFIIKEEELSFKDVIVGIDTISTVGTEANDRTINRLWLTMQDNRELYPYTVNLTADQGKTFVRTGLTINYFFNYSPVNTGLKARLFAGKFFYLKDNTLLERINNNRYAFNMSGPSGYEDYTYSNYFLGRREFEGVSSQQIMERDGFFKVRSEQLSEEIGKTDDWLVAVNLSTDVPDNINPLRVLPFKVPIKVFVDIGTYANADNATGGTGKFLYDAGLQLPLFKSAVNIYFPILYSKVYRDFYKSTITKGMFTKNIAFTIDFQKLMPTKLLSELRL